MSVKNLPFVLLSPEELDLVTHDQIAITGLIGVGTTGVVYKAQQIRLGRTVAVKVLSKVERKPFCEFRSRFLQEAKAMARLNHPNIVRIHDLGETKTGFPYLVMEYVDGVDLATLIRGGQLTMEHVASWVPQACEAVEYAHNHEVIHQDLKPVNLVIEAEGRVKVTDFGLVRVKGRAAEDQSAPAHLLAGTRRYLAPEVAQGEGPVDHRADVYSMGVILYELLTGTVSQREWVAPSKLRAGVPPQLDAVVARAMQRKPSDRYPRIADLGRDVLAVARSAQPGAGPLSFPRAGVRPEPRSAAPGTDGFGRFRFPPR